MAREARSRATTTKKGGGFLGKLLCLFLGFILGIVGTIGGIGGLGYYVVTQVKIKDAFETINGMTGADINYNDFVTEEIGEGTPYDLVMTIVDAVEEIGSGSGSLETLNKISPLVGTNIQNLINSVKEYGVEIEYNVLMNKPFADIGTYLSDTLNGLEIAPILNAVGVEASGLIALLCYGEEGRDFYYETDDNGEYVLDENGHKIIVPVEGSQFATVGSLIDGALLNERLGNLSFKGLMSALSNGGVNTEDTLILTLAYGIEGEDYVMVDGEPVALPLAYEYNDGDNTFIAPDGSVFVAVPETTDQWKCDDTYIIRNEGENSDLYEFEVVRETEEDGATKFNAVYQLGYNEEDGNFIAYKGGVMQKRGGLLLSDIIGEDANLMDAIAPIRLGDLIGLNGESDKLLLTLAYGKEGVDYEIVDNKIVPIEGGNSPLSIGDLTSGDLDVLDKIELGSLLGVDLFDDKEDMAIMVVLAYGNEGTHYELDHENKEIIWKVKDEATGETYKARTIGDLLEDQDFLNDIEIASLIGIDLFDDKEDNSIMVVLAYGNEGTHYELDHENKEIIWKVKDEATGEKYHARTIGDLLESQDFLNEIEIASLIGIDLFDDEEDNSIMVVLAYGNEGTHYELDHENKEIIWKVKDEATGEKYHARTIGDLLEDQDFLNDIEIASLIGLDILDEEEDNSIMVVLAYGNEGTHYTIETNDDGEKYINWLENEATGEKYKARTIGDLINNQDFVNDIEIAALIGLDILDEEEDETLMVVLAYGNEGTHYTIETNDEGKKYINWLENEATGEKYKARTIGDLINDQDFVNDIEIAALIGLDILDEEEDETLMVVLAYGNEGTHYTIETNDEGEKYINWLKNEATGEKYHARTIGDLINDQDFVNDIEIASLIGLDILDEEEDNSIMVVLAYGNEGTHYTIETNDEGEKYINWLKNEATGEKYHARTIGDLINDQDFVNDIELAPLLGVDLFDDEEDDPIIVALVYGNEGEHYTIETNDDGKEYIKWLENKATGETYKARTIGSLIDDKDILNTIELATVFGINLFDDEEDDPIMVALAYGNEGEHYTIETNDEGKEYINWLENKATGEKYHARTIADLLNDKELLNSIELATVLGINLFDDEEDDPLMVALAYGNEGTHYEIVNGEIVWKVNEATGEKYKARTIGSLMNDKDILYTIELATILGVNLFDDEEDDPIIVALAYGNEGTHYTIETNENGEKYIDWKVKNKDTGETYKARTIADLLNDKDILNTIELGTVLGVDILDPEEDAIMLAFAYGTKGTHYKIVDGKVEWQPDGNGGTYRPRTIKDLQDKGIDILNDIELSTLFGVDATDPEADKILVTLAYGTEGTHYEIKTGEDGKPYVDWKFKNEATDEKYKPRTVYDFRDQGLDILNDIPLDVVLGIDLFDDTADDDIMVALVYGNEGTHYTIETDENGKEYINWLEDESGKKYAPRTIGQLKNENATLLNDIELGLVLGVHPLDEKPDKVMLAIAYGNDGTHYEIKTGNDGKPFVDWKFKDETQTEKYKPRTIADLKEDGADLVNDVELGAVLGVSPLKDGDDQIMVALAYGNEGTHYVIGKDANGQPYIEWQYKDATQTQKYAPRTIGELKGDKGADIVNNIELGLILGVSPLKDGDDAIMVALAYGNEGTHYVIGEDENGQPCIEWQYTDATKTKKFAPRTIGELRSEDGTDLVNGIELGLILDVNPLKDDSDKIMVALAYGNEGTHYVIGEDENGQPRIEWQYTDDTKTTQYAPRTIGTLVDDKNIINNIELGLILDVHPLKEGSDAVMLAIAYGNEGTHYEIKTGDDGKPYVAWIGNNSARTISNLTGENGSKLLNDIELAAVLGVSPLDEDPNEIMIAIAYGTEGKHYEIATDDNGKEYVKWLEKDSVTGEKYHPTTIGELTEKGKTILDELYLEAILGVNARSDGMMRSLAYGNEGTHYEIDKKGTPSDNSDDEIVMLPKTYTISDNQVTDQDDKDVGTITANENGVYTVTQMDGEGEDATTTTIYIKYDETDGVYYGYTDQAKMTEADRILNTKTTLSELRGGKTSDLLNRMELAAALNLNILDDEEDDLLMVALAYGTEGTHYEIKTNEDGEKYIEWLRDPATGEKYRANTIGDLQNDGANLLNGLTLESLLNVTASSEDIMLSLAFGNKGVHYEINAENKIVMLPVIYFLKDSKVIDQDGNEIGSTSGADDMGVYQITLEEKDENDNYIIRYAKVSTDENGNNMYVYADIDDATNEVAEKRLVHKKTTLEDLRGENSDELVERISLASILNVNPLDPNADKLMVALVYGNEGEHYRIDDKQDDDPSNDEIVWLPNPDGGNYKPRTLHQLKENSNDLIDTLYLDAVLNLDLDASDMMLALALGNEGTHYKIVDGKAVMLERKVFLGAPDSNQTVTVYDEEHIAVGILGQPVENEHGHIIYEITEWGKTSKLYIRKAYEEGNTVDAHYHVYNSSTDAINDEHIVVDNAEDTTRLYHQKTMFKDLRTTDSATYIERIELSAALGVDINSDNEMMKSLVFGNEDEHYEITRNENGAITNFKWLTDEETGLPYHARTIHDLKNTDEILDGIYLDTILGIDDSSTPIMKMLVWGPDYETNKVRKRVSELKAGEDLINDIYLDTALSLNASSPAVLLSIAYGAAYEIEGNKVKGFAIYNIGEDNETVNAGDIVYNQQGTEVGTLGEPTNGVYPVSKDGNTFYIKETNGIYYAYANAEQTQPENRLPYRTKIGDLKANDGKAAEKLITGVRMDNIISTDGTSAIMNYLVYNTTNPDDNTPSRTLGDFMENGDDIVDSMLDALNLADVLPAELQNNKFLKHINFENTTLEQLGAELDNLAVQDILAEDLYEWAWFDSQNGYSYYSNVEPANNSGRYVRCIVGEGNVAIKATEAPVTIGGEEYVSYVYCSSGNAYNGKLPLQGVWKYLLMAKNVQGQDREIYCNLTALGGVSNNLTVNMEGTTLRQLKADGIIDISDDILNQRIIKTLNIPGMESTNITNVNATYLGELSINDAMSYIFALSGALTAFATH